jgi:hypothetical protein
MKTSRFLRVLGWAGAAVLIAGVSIARIGAQDPDDPFHDHGDNGETIHVLPAPALAHRVSNGDQAIFAPVHVGTAVFPPSYGSGPLTDHHGPEISNASFRAIYWNSAVANSTATSQGYLTISSQIDAFISSYASGQNWSGSPTDDYTVIQQYGSSNPIAPTLPNLSYHVDSQRTASRITDSSIQSYLTSLFRSGEEAPSASTIYGVYFPHGMRVTLQGGSSCTSFCGYHSHFTYNGTLIKYAVFPYADCSGCSLSGLSVADMLTIVTSHEVRESVSDSLGTAWYDSRGYEADDKCAWHNLYQTTAGHFWVQPEYSNGGTTSNSGFTATYPGPGCVVPNQ